jgi:hypothetical protein
MNLRRTTGPLAALLLLPLLVLLTAAFAQQAREKIPDHRFERATVIDAEGLKQWAPWEQPCSVCKKVKQIDCPLCEGRESPNCIECGGDKRAVCRACAGTAKHPDPVVEIICAYCRGAGVYPCPQCWGAGFFKVANPDGSAKKLKCRGCKERGGFDCTPCDGTRLLQAVTVKRKPLGEAKLKDMRALREDLKETLDLIGEFRFERSHRKTEKSLQKLFKGPSKSFPVLADMLELLATVHKGYAKVGTGYESFSANLTHQFYIFIDRTVWLLRNQILLVDMEIARAEFNAAVLEETK